MVSGAAAGFNSCINNLMFTPSYLRVGSFLGSAFCSFGLYGSGVMAEQCCKKEKNDIRSSLDNFTILFSVALTAGQSDITALREAAEGTAGPLKQEVKRALVENDTGKNLNDALYDMAERCDVDELWAIVRVIVQARRHGSPLAQEMRIHSQTIRNTRRLGVMEEANRLSVKLLFPVMLILLSIIAALGYPAVVALMQAL